MPNNSKVLASSTLCVKPDSMNGVLKAVILFLFSLFPIISDSYPYAMENVLIGKSEKNDTSSVLPPVTPVLSRSFTKKPK